MRLLQQYKGRLTPAAAAEGMNAAITNAKRLAEDANLLFGKRRYPTASSLAILSLEEQGKCGILRELLTAPSDDEIAECWKRYRRHTDKNYLALLPDYVRKGAPRLHHFRDLFMQDTESRRATFDAIKQLGLYTDCCGNCHWSVPSEVVEQTLAAVIVPLASALSENTEPVTVEELDLWCLHMRGGLTREHLLNWCAAMVSAGLKPANYMDGMRRFTEGSSGTTDILGGLSII
ncbi:MAG: AbiV family abortive infection protein [Bryobacteraceae bacterium]|jgi:AbiV family abortive infection protein